MLETRPTVLGLVPSLYDSSRAIHRQYLQQLPEVAEQLRVKLYADSRFLRIQECERQRPALTKIPPSPSRLQGLQSDR